MKLCLVEDDLALGRSLQAALQDAGHEVLWLRRMADARAWVDDLSLDALLLDLGLPDGNGLDLLREVRGQGVKLPVLILSAREGLDDRLRGLDLGADDYLVKPFATSELIARLKAIVRRATGRGPQGESTWAVQDVVLDEQRMTVTRAAVPVALSKTEFTLLHELMRHSNRVLTRRELEARVLPQSEGQSLDVHISNLRKKLGDGLVRTVRGVGYLVER